MAGRNSLADAVIHDLLGTLLCQYGVLYLLLILNLRFNQPRLFFRLVVTVLTADGNCFMLFDLSNYPWSLQQAQGICSLSKRQELFGGRNRNPKHHAHVKLLDWLVTLVLSNTHSLLSTQRFSYCHILPALRPDIRHSRIT